MLWNRNRNQILSDWRESLDYSLEAGGTPLFDIGLSYNMLDGLISLAAVQDFSEKPQPTLTHPLLAIGGNSAFWLLILDLPQLKTGQVRTTRSDNSTGEEGATEDSDHRAACTFDTVFTGVDLATHMASLTVNAGPSRTMHSRSPKVRATGLPAALRALTFPQLEPAVISSWQALPLTISLPKLSLRSLYSAPTNSSMLDQNHLSSPTSLGPDGFETLGGFETLDQEQLEEKASVLQAAESSTIENDSWVSIISLLVSLLLIFVALLG